MTPSRFTAPLRTLVVVCSAVFVLGTAAQAFVIIDERAMTEMMLRAGADPAGAPAFLLGFRVVGCLYLAGNALGLLARRGGPWLFWVVLLVNVTQAAGVVAIPPEMWAVTYDRFGPAGLLPSAVTDGGALLLSLVMLASVARYRTAWAGLRGRSS